MSFKHFTSRKISTQYFAECESAPERAFVRAVSRSFLRRSGFWNGMRQTNRTGHVHAPLILVPLDIDRRREDQRYRYFVNTLDEIANRNTTLEMMLRQNFGLVLPELSEEDTQKSTSERFRSSVSRNSPAGECDDS